MAVVSMSKQEFGRLEVLLRVQSGRLRVSDACALIGLRRRLLSSAPHGLIADDDAPLGQKQIDVPQAAAEHVIWPDSVADNLRSEAMAVVWLGGGRFHAADPVGLCPGGPGRLS
jgi:hypothetical protein